MAVTLGTVSSWSELILRHRQFLIKQIELDFGLLDKLYADEVLSDEDKDDIDAEKAVYKRNSKLLECIQTRKQYAGFIEALKSSNQKHVSKYLEKNALYASDDDDWPLLEQQRKILRTNRATLIDLLDVQDLLIRLYSAHVISRGQRDFISTKQTSDEQNRALLDILCRRSIRDYKMMIRCLHESKQNHIAEILEEGGVVVRLHAKVPHDRTEDEIISQFRMRSTEERQRILDVLSVIAMKKDKSIIVYVYYKTFDELIHFQKLKTSGELVTVLRKLFIDILSFAKCADVENPRNVVEMSFAESQIEKMTVDVSEEEYDKSKEYFLIEEERINEIMPPQDQSELLNLELSKEVETECEVKDPRGCYSFGPKMACASLTESVRDFLQERIDPDHGLLDLLLRKRILSGKEIENIKGEKSCRKRNLKLLDIIEGKCKLVELSKALREADQAHIANYMDANGEYRSEFGAVWPLAEREQSILDTNHGALVEHIFMHDLLNKLYAGKVINKRQMETISSKLTEHEKNKVFLKILERGSIEDYTKTIQYLHDSHQSHVANVLSEGLVVLKLHTEMSGDGNPENIGEIEDKLATKISDFIKGEIPEATRGTILRVLDEANLKVIAAKKGN